jgi:TolB-like protein/Tfp pilus assembly protein PilF
MPDDHARVNASLAGRYRVERELGRGGMATVYLAHDLKHDRAVALKVMRPELARSLGVSRFVREIQISAQLNHPNILTLIDSGEADGLLYYVMPYVEGETLRARLTREKQLPLDDALRITAEIADALGYAHSLGLVHRDIKPENILFQAGHAVVSDFGIARALSQAGGEHLTESGLAVGTLAYMSPEQASGSRELDGRSDIYSLGCVLYEMLAGEPPFFTPGVPSQPRSGGAGAGAGSGSGASVRASRETVSPAIDQVVMRALARLPADRFTTAAQFKEALQGAATQPRMRVGRPGSLVAVAALLVAATLLLPSSRRLWQRLVGGGSGARAVKLAVLPFVNLTGDSSQDYLTDGLTEEMTAQLGQLHPQGLTVIGTASAAHYKHTTESLDRVGRELGVGYLLEGSARRQADTIRVTSRLIRVGDQTQMWADSYERRLSDILALQADVARGIARSLALVLLPAERSRLAASRPVNPQAYEAYLRGREHARTLRQADLDAAQQYFEQALREDPTYALAYVGLAFVWAGRQQMGLLPPSETVPKAKAAVERALALDSTLAEAHYQMAIIKTATDWDWAGAEAEFQRAIAFNPNLAEARAFYGHLLLILRRTDEATMQMQRALELDPLNGLLHALYAVVLVGARRDDDAIALDTVLLRTSPGNPVALGSLSDAYADKGMFAKAVAATRALYAANDDAAGVVPALDSGYARGGYRGAMRAVAAREATLARRIGAGQVNVGLFYARGGERDSAIAWFERAYTARDPNLPYVPAMLAADSISRDPRFQALARRMGLSGDARQTR